MKIILFVACVAVLLSTCGCLVDEGGRHHDRGHDRDAGVVVPVIPVVVVHPSAEVIVR